MTLQEMPPAPEEEAPSPEAEQTDSLSDAPVSPETPPPPSEAAPPPDGAVPSDDEPPPPSSRWRARLRPILRILIGVFIIFGLGYWAALVTIYQPLAERYRGAEAEAERASSQAERLQADLETANAKAEALQERLEGLTAEREALREELDSADLHFYTLRALADVQGARLALTGEDPATAQVYLSKVPSYLAEMHSLAGDDVQEALDDMQKRLALALRELDEDPSVAATDLAILADWLRQFETTLP